MPLDQHPFWGKELIGTLTIVKILGLVCLVMALGKIFLGDARPQLLRFPHARWYLAFFLFQCASYFLHAGHLVNGAMTYSNVFSILALFITVLTVVDNNVKLNRTLLAAIAAGGYASLYTIRQQQKYGDMYGFRPGGTMGDANEYALVVALWMPLAFIWAFSRRPLWERAVCFGCLASMLVGTTFAASRGGFIGLSAAMLFLIWNSRNRVRNFVFVSALIIPLTLLSPSSVINRFRNPNYGDMQAERARLITWKAGLQMIRAHPLIGIGLNNFRPMVTQYEPPDEQVISLAHNTYVEVAAELGIPALFVFVGTFIAGLVSLERVRRRARLLGAPHLFNIAVGLQAGIVSYLVSAFFMSAWWQKLLWLLLFSSFCLTRLAAAATKRAAIEAETARASVPTTKGDRAEPLAPFHPERLNA